MVRGRHRRCRKQASLMLHLQLRLLVLLVLLWPLLIRLRAAADVHGRLLGLGCLREVRRQELLRSGVGKVHTVDAVDADEAGAGRQNDEAVVNVVRKPEVEGNGDGAGGRLLLLVHQLGRAAAELLRATSAAVVAAALAGLSVAADADALRLVVLDDKRGVEAVHGAGLVVGDGVGVGDGLAHVLGDDVEEVNDGLLELGVLRCCVVVRRLLRADARRAQRHERVEEAVERGTVDPARDEADKQGCARHSPARLVGGEGTDAVAVQQRLVQLGAGTGGGARVAEEHEAFGGGARPRLHLHVDGHDGAETLAMLAQRAVLARAWQVRHDEVTRPGGAACLLLMLLLLRRNLVLGVVGVVKGRNARVDGHVAGRRRAVRRPHTRRLEGGDDVHLAVRGPDGGHGVAARRVVDRADEREGRVPAVRRGAPGG
mmetsp:Transcript_41420/g.128003  ORF Transcript_41420/g.128003 Transcript_41420/m.128003 type:complete len:429 (+) Transcript_41420:714-2000(+)